MAGMKERRSASAKIANLFDAARAAPMLSREEEHELALRSQGGDAGAAQRLVMSHLRFVVSLARRYRTAGLPLQDLVQEGALGLFHATRRFNPDRGVRFATYAMWWVRAAMQDHVMRSWSLVRVGTTKAHKALFQRLRRLAAESGGALYGDGADPLAEEKLGLLAHRFGIARAELQQLARRFLDRDRSLETGANDDSMPIAARLADPRPDPESLLAGEKDGQFWRQKLAQALAQLTPREKHVIQRRYFAEAGVTFEAIGRELGLSKERARQLERAALEKIRSLLPRDRYGVAR